MKMALAGKIKKYSGFGCGENLWGKFMGKIYGKKLLGSLFKRLVKETVAGQKQLIHICI